MKLFAEAKVIPGRQTIVFGNSLGTTLEMWRPQVEALSQEFNTICFDLPGHGSSPSDENYRTIEDITDGLIETLNNLGVNHVTFCGLSIGGAIGQVLGARYPQYVNGLVLVSTSGILLTPDIWKERIRGINTFEGMNWVIKAAPSRHFTAEFISSHPKTVQDVISWLSNIKISDYSQACEALAVFDGYPYANEIQARTLVISGAEDIAIPVSEGEKLASKLANSKFKVIENAAHLCNVEQPGIFNKMLRDFILDK